MAKDKSIGQANQKRSPRTSQLDRPIKIVCQGQVNRTGQSKASITGQSIGRTNQVTFTKKRRRAARPIRFVWQEARRTPRHTRRKHRLSQSKGFGVFFGRTFRRKHRISQSKVFGAFFGRTFRRKHRLSQSKGFGASFGRTLKTESLAKPITFIGWIIFGRIIFGRIIFRRTFFGRTFFGRIIPQDGIVG